MLTLYDYYRSSASSRVRIALHLKNVSHQVIPIHLVQDGGQQFSSSFANINPHHLLPALKHEDKILTQSLAIIEYLDEMYPSPALLPKDPFEKALVRSFALSIAADIHPLNNLRVLKYLTNELAVAEDKKNNWYQHWIEKGLSALEKQLQSYQKSGHYCFGNEPTLADICLVPQLYNARRFSCDVNQYPTLLKIDAHCQSHPAFKKAWPEET